MRKCLLASQEVMWFKQLGYLVIWLDDQPVSQLLKLAKTLRSQPEPDGLQLQTRCASAP